MKNLELKDKSVKDLQKTLEEKRNRLCQLRFELSQGKAKNIRELRITKKEIARIMTLISQKIKISNS